MIAAKVLIEGLGLGFLLYLVCAIGIRSGAVGMVHLYSDAVQRRAVELGLTSPDEIGRRGLAFKAICIPGYVAYVLACVYLVNGARGFWECFWQMFAILTIMNLIDRLLIDGYWVGHTDAWDIPGTEELKPYISRTEKRQKWLMGTVGMAVISAVLSAVMCLVAR